MQSAVESMNLLIEDLLEVSKIETGQMPVEPKRIAAKTWWRMQSQCWSRWRNGTR